MYTVVRQRVIGASLERTWRCLSDPAEMQRWFAEVDRLQLEEAFRFDFGDGDFFAGKVRQWQPPSFLELEWKFMGIGPRFDIAFHLSPLSSGRTEVTVVDRGSLTLAEVEALREGWQDFLGRLAQLAGTGTPCRYEWSETIGTGALLAGTRGTTPDELVSDEWWQQAFAGAAVSFAPAGEAAIRARFADSAWQGVETEALIETLGLEGGTYLGVTHRGWPRLPTPRRLAERRRYAHFWRAALDELEQRYR